MTPKAIASLIILGINKTLRESVVPSDFNGLSGLIEQLKANPVTTLQGVLKDELGVEWDGKSKLGDVLIEDWKRDCKIDRARKLIDSEIIRLSTASRVIQFQGLAGRVNVDRVLAEVFGDS